MRQRVLLPYCTGSPMWRVAILNNKVFYITPTRQNDTPKLVSSPDPYSQQLRVDYITATWKVGLGNKNDALVPSVLQCLCPKIVRQSKFRTNLAQLERNKRYHFRMILLRVLSIVAFGRAASEDWVCFPLPFSGRVLQN